MTLVGIVVAVGVSHSIFHLSHFPPLRFNFQISSCVKYMIFLLNFIFWLFGGLMIGIGECEFSQDYALVAPPLRNWVEKRRKTSTNNSSKKKMLPSSQFLWMFASLGFYAFYEKWQATGLVKVDTIYDIVLNISLVLVILGGIVFVVSFAGCLGALRENTVRISLLEPTTKPSMFSLFNATFFSLCSVCWNSTQCACC